MQLSGATFRRFLPPLGVTAIIVLAALAPAPSMASSTNNCGVKGYGYHDHGKPCPNRPFPGKGVNHDSNDNSALNANGGETRATKNLGNAVTKRSSSATMSSSDIVTTTESHASGHGHSHGKKAKGQNEDE